METERLRQFVLGCASCSRQRGGGLDDYKVGGGDERGARESSTQPGRR